MYLLSWFLIRGRKKIVLSLSGREPKLLGKGLRSVHKGGVEIFRYRRNSHILNLVHLSYMKKVYEILLETV